MGRCGKLIPTEFGLEVCNSTENLAVPSEHQCCLNEFADVELQDARLNARCGELAAKLGEHPSLPLNQACEDLAGAKAAYRFFDNDDVTPERILAPHQQRTVERMASHPRVLAIQDTTLLNYTHHPKTEGLGPIGKKSLKQRGFTLHSTLAVLPDGLPLGLLTQAILTRPENESSHRPEECRLQPIEEKESYRWLQAFEQTLALAPTGVEVITVCDREADICEMFAFAHKNNAPLLVRASSDRALLDVEVRKLWPKLTGQPLAGYLTVKITGNDTRPARQTAVSVRTVAPSAPGRPANSRRARRCASPRHSSRS